MMPKLIDSIVLPKDLINSSYVSLFVFRTQGLTFDDPIFPAIFESPADRFEEPKGFFYNDTFITILGCIDSTVACDSESGRCVTNPAHPSSDLDRGIAEGAAVRVPAPFALYKHLKGDTTAAGMQELVDGAEAPDAELAHALLSNALWGSNLCMMYRVWNRLECSSCYNSVICRGIPPDQWKIEVRQWFETSLAQIQFNVFDTVRGGNGAGGDYAGIPLKYRGLCKMGKFRSIRWRNVSVWALFLLLFLAGGVSLISVKTEEEELWLIVGARLLKYTLQSTVRGVKRLALTLKMVCFDV